MYNFFPNVFLGKWQLWQLQVFIISYEQNNEIYYQLDELKPFAFFLQSVSMANVCGV